jgi:hypothetical protein
MVFLGYRAKRPWRPDPAWDPEGKTGVVEVCSASDCLSSPPPDWEKRWDYNGAACYADATEAIATVPPSERSHYRVFAYWLLGNDDPLSLFEPAFPPVPGGDGPSDFEALGFDVVEIPIRSASGPARLPGFGNSPLSCNLLAREVRVNRYCLVDDREEALRLVARFNREQPEPGTYFAVLIALERRSGASNGQA